MSWMRRRQHSSRRSPDPVEQGRHEPGRAAERPEDRADFFAREDDREALRALRAHDAVQPGDVDLEHLAVEEQQRAQRLVLRGCRDPSLDRQ